MPVQKRRHASGGKRSVIASAFIRVGAHDPFRIARTPLADRQVEIVQKTALQRLGLHLAGAPFGVGIDCYRHGRRVGLLLDQESPTGLARVLSCHVHREHVLNAACLVWSRGQPLAAPADLVDPHESQRSFGAWKRASPDCLDQRASQPVERPAPAPIVVGAGLLHVRDHDDTFVRPRASWNLSDDGTIRTVVKGCVNRDTHHHGTLLEALTHPIRGTP